MRFLLDANVPRRLGDIIVAVGHECTDVRDTPLASGADAQIAEFAQREGCALLTRDFDFADVRAYPPETLPGVVVISAPGTTPVADICALFEAFLADADTVAALPGRLAILEFWPRATSSADLTAAVNGA